MNRLKDYARFLTWNFGLGYIALWPMALWTLDHGQAFFSGTGQCKPDPATALFYWICDPASPASIVATLANSALTVTVWGPVYIAAAAVKANALPVALPIVAIHIFGFSAVILITARSALWLLQTMRGLGRRAPPSPPDDARTARHEFALPAGTIPSVEPHDGFGLRGAQRR
jgi:hypothetical protein